MGLIVDIYRSQDIDCTRNGISSRARGLCLVNVPGPNLPSCDYPAALLVAGRGRGLVRIVPAAAVSAGIGAQTWQPAQGWWMMGGNYAATSDSRFHEAVEAITGLPNSGAVAIHDRQE